MAPWCTSLLRVSFVAGMAVGIAGRVLQAAWGDVEEPLVMSAVTTLWTSVWFSLVGLSAAFATAPLRTSRAGRWAALAACTAALTVAAGVHLLLVGVRVLTGTYPTIAALEMFWNSPSQFFHAGTVGHARHMVLFGVAVGASAAAVGTVLARAGEPARPLRVRALVAAAALSAAMVAVFVTIPPRTAFYRAFVTSAPELAVLTALQDTLPPASEEVASGPPLSAEQQWLEAARAWTGPRPNVLLLMLESVPANHVGYAGYHRQVTPHLDQLAARGVRYRRVWATSTQSNYAQTALLSSLFPRRAPTLDWHVRLDYPRRLFHDVFQRLGYATATVSSQNENWQGMRRFQNTGTPTHYRDSNDHPGPHFGAGEERKLPDHLTTDVLLEWLGAQKGPWSAYVNFQRTHFPYQLPDGFAGPWQPSDPDLPRFGYLSWEPKDLDKIINRYDNALHYVDAQIGRIARWLEERGALEDTLLVVTADHGEALGTFGMTTHGMTLDEAQARAPLVIHWPKKLQPADVDLPVSAVDILPSMLELLGAPPHPAFQGRSFVDPARFLAEKNAVFMHLVGLRAVDGVVCWPWKLTLDYTARTVALRDLSSDPDERLNLITPGHPVADALMDLVLTQMSIQDRYHAARDRTRGQRFAPRMLPCPELPAPDAVASGR